MDDDMAKEQQVICPLVLTAPNAASFRGVTYDYSRHSNVNRGKVKPQEDRERRKESREKHRDRQMHTPSERPQ